MFDWECTLLALKEGHWTICLHLRDMYPIDGAHLRNKFML
jgi:hypothetical protein